jgi:hypothetical protein
MKKPLRLFIVILLAMSVTVLPGCLPKLKDGASFTPPSWKVAVQVPLVKKHFVLSDVLADLKVTEQENIIINQDSIYTFVQQFQPEPLTLDMPDLNQAVDQLDLPTIHWGSAAFQVDIPNTFDVTFDYTIDDLGVGDLAVSTEVISLNPTTIIEIPFESIKLSNANMNSIHFTLTSDEPIDGLTLQLVDAQGNAIGQLVDFGSVAGATTVPQYTRERTMNLGGQTIPRQMKFKLELQAHSTSGHIKLDVAMNNQLEVVELIPVANDPDNPLIQNIPQINIPEIKPLENFGQIQEIKFASGTIRFQQNKTHSQDHPFPFTIDFAQMGIDGDKTRIYQDTNGDICLNMNDLVLTPTTTIGGAAIALINNPVYDVWDDATNTMIPYSYDLSFAFEDVEIAYIRGDASMISDLVPDPNPATPGHWDYVFEPVASGIQEITYPGSVEDFAIGLTNIFLTMDLTNNTSLMGSFTLKLKVYSDKYGTVLMKDGKPVEAVFTILVDPRSETHFLFEKQDDYHKFIDILNSKPKYVEYFYEGLLELPEIFELTPNDSFTSDFSLSLPLSFTIGAGGAKIPEVYTQNMTLPADQREIVSMAYEFIDEATLNIRYTNQSSIGLGGTITFSTPDGREEAVNSVIFNNRSGIATLKVTRNLLDILQNEAGFEIVCDLLIPNDTGAARLMSIKASDELNVTVWLDAKVRAHVPSQH